ncbi:MAG: hypothetical protein M3548_16370 [Actinomycetota bacterium]|nr:hypothetical protein [Actinomycetota bacterium]
MANSLLPSAAIDAAGADHVRLAYDYLDAGDFDAYGSLLDEHTHVCGIGPDRARGRDHAVRAAKARAESAGRHHLYKVIVDNGNVVATGRYVGLSAAAAFDFADVFTLSDDGLLLSHRRFRYIEGPG